MHADLHRRMGGMRPALSCLSGVVAVLLVTPPNAVADSGDDTFLQYMKNSHIASTAGSVGLISAGYGACQLLLAGYHWTEVARAVENRSAQGLPAVDSSPGVLFWEGSSLPLHGAQPSNLVNYARQFLCPPPSKH